MLCKFRYMCNCAGVYHLAWIESHPSSIKILFFPQMTFKPPIFWSPYLHTFLFFSFRVVLSLLSFFFLHILLFLFHYLQGIFANADSNIYTYYSTTYLGKQNKIRDYAVAAWNATGSREQRGVGNIGTSMYREVSMKNINREQGRIPLQTDSGI